jgi:hypothetical protein
MRARSRGIRRCDRTRTVYRAGACRPDWAIEPGRAAPTGPARPGFVKSYHPPMQHSAVARLFAGILLVGCAAVCAWMGYLNIRDRWDEPDDAGRELPFCFRPRITLRAWVGGACGLVAFLCALFILGVFKL